MKVIIAGSRSIRNDLKNLTNLTKIIKELNWEIDEILCGKAKGADSLGEAYAKKFKIKLNYFPAKWDDLEATICKIKENSFGKKYNCLAGHNRNEEMAKNADALIIIHKNTPGSLDMLNRAKKHKLIIKEIVV